MTLNNVMTTGLICDLGTAEDLCALLQGGVIRKYGEYALMEVFAVEEIVGRGFELGTVTALSAIAAKAVAAGKLSEFDRATLRRS